MEQLLGKWENQYGSVLDIERNEQGHLFGKFLTKVGRDETKNLWRERWFGVTGVQNGDLVALIINYPESKALGTHAGKLHRNGEDLVLKVQGLFVQDLPEDQVWRQSVITATEFHRI